jgi:DNA-binding response OmpR family regulator
LSVVQIKIVRWWMTGNIDRVPALGLVLEHDRRRATRESGHSTELGGNGRLWDLLEALARRHDAYYPTNDLIRAVWVGYSVEAGTLWGAVSDLRKALLPLGLTIRHVKGLGYRLEDLAKT